MGVLGQKTLQIQAVVLVMAWLIALLSGDAGWGTVGFWVAAEALALLAIGGLTGLGGSTHSSGDFRSVNRTLIHHQITSGLNNYRENQRSSLGFQMLLILNAIVAFMMGLFLAVLGG